MGDEGEGTVHNLQAFSCSKRQRAHRKLSTFVSNLVSFASFAQGLYIKALACCKCLVQNEALRTAPVRPAVGFDVVAELSIADDQAVSLRPFFRFPGLSQ